MHTKWIVSGGLAGLCNRSKDNPKDLQDLKNSNFRCAIEKLRNFFSKMSLLVGLPLWVQYPGHLYVSPRGYLYRKTLMQLLYPVCRVSLWVHCSELREFILITVCYQVKGLYVLPTFDKHKISSLELCNFLKRNHLNSSVMIWKVSAFCDRTRDNAFKLK